MKMFTTEQSVVRAGGDAVNLAKRHYGWTDHPQQAKYPRAGFFSFRSTRFMAATFFLLAAVGRDARSGEAELTFERDVRPILKTHCFHCHGEGEELAGGLDVRLRRLLVEGGESGSAITPESTHESLLLERIRSGEMPPEDVAIRPTTTDIDTIERWIALGAATAGPEPDSIGKGLYITDEERSFWAFQPVVRPVAPDVRDESKVGNPIDRFLLKRLESNGLTFSPPADRRTLLRRAYFDLIGLPPSPAAEEQFINDKAPGAFQRMVDRLLASPQYGERWGRIWLDIAGYADSEGYTDADPVRADAFRYRDYVIRSLNANKPFDTFIQEQLAGDELVGPPYKNLDEAAIERLTATGFLRMAPDGTGVAGVQQDVARNDTVADTVKIVSSSLLGLTVGCAQCHHHRYDPIAHEDYYGFRAIFEPALDWKAWKTPAQRRLSLYTDADREQAAAVDAEAKKVDAERLKKQQEFIDRTFERELAKLPEEIHDAVRSAKETPEKKRTAEQKKLLKEHPAVNVTASSLYLYDRKAADELKKFTARAKKIRDGKPVERHLRCLAEAELSQPPATFVFLRGDHQQPSQQVEPGELQVLCQAENVEIPENDVQRSTTGRRLAYAKWLTSGRHPLVARVAINRVWLNHFGKGIVTTPGDFGFLGARPTHPQLLDWLADEFVRSGWDLKHMHRMMMASTAYRQSSLRYQQGETIDGENLLYWRMNIRRLDAEVVRDSVLSVSGQLINRQFGPAVPVMADRVGQFVIGIENLNAGRPGAVIPMKGEDLRRSIYIQVRRSRPLGALDTFDLPAMTPNCTKRNSSTVATQSLMLMNSDFVIASARVMAERIQREVGNERESQVKQAWRLLFADGPSESDLRDALSFIDQQQELLADDSKKTDESVAALASFCHALLSSNEFLYVD